MKDESFGAILDSLTRKYGISFGIELSFDESYYNDFEIAINSGTNNVFLDKSSNFSLDFTEAPLSDVMDSLMEQMEGYRWEVSDDVVNVFPLNKRDPALSRLMNLSIKSFVLKDESDLIVGKILDNIVLLPEVVNFQSQNKIAIPRTHYGDSKALFRKINEVRMSDVSFKQVLNRSAIAKQGSWQIYIVRSPEKAVSDKIILKI